MATLVLSVVGTIFGGPIGGAIGAVAGSIIDQTVIFKPKGRQGPRLTELAVQTSSYGTLIPRLYGTIRVAGIVIWSTDLIERQGGSGGKGSGSSFSYSVSFAVLLSARPIRSVGRIWADGKLVRGAAGDFKTQTGYRLHLGGEDQAPDPLIAAAEGSALTPATRGGAYAVFENFQLADYGNRLPSLTFEVEADDVPVAAGAIAADVSGGTVDGMAASLPLSGFSAYGDSVRGVLETLASISGTWFAPDGAGLRMVGTAEPVRTIADAGFSLPGVQPGDRVTASRTIAAIDTVAQTVSVAHYDPARDYQTGLQRARRPGAGNRNERVDLPAVLAAGDAKAVADAVLARAEAGRTRRSVALGWDAIDIAPGATIGILGETGRWRVSGWTLERMVVGLDLVQLDAATPIAGGGASAGRVAASPDLVHGPTTLHAFEIPAIDDALANVPRLWIAAAGSEPGWRRASLMISLDRGSTWTDAGMARVPATMGRIVSPPGAGPAQLVDHGSTIDIDLLQPGMSLRNSDDAGSDAGANMALVGRELLQFGRAEQLGDIRWRLSRLIRGRRGTEDAIGRQQPGDPFVLIDPATLVGIDLPLSRIGGLVYVMAVGVGDIGGPGSAQAALSGASVRPPVPVHLRATAQADGGLSVRWTRRSRGGWRWADGSDAPLVEEREAYRVTLALADGTVLRSFDVAGPRAELTAADLAGATRLWVQQQGSLALSARSIITI